MAELEVRLYGEPIGRLVRAGRGSRFEAYESWCYARFQPLLGVSWIQDPRPRVAAEGLPAWFDNLLPEPGSALRQRIAAAAGVPESDGFGLLAAVGTDLPGAVTIVGEARDVDACTDPGEAKIASGSLHFSLAGMQLKFSLVLRETGKLTLPVPGEQGSFIAKLPGDGRAALPAIEAMTLRWAGACGHAVPGCRRMPLADIGELASLATFDGEEVLLVERYDRTPQGPVHQEDFCQVFSVFAADRYMEHDPHRTLSYEALARFAADIGGAEAGREFVRRIAFVLASGNTDAHLQNWSLLLPRAGGIGLAPLYDQVSVIAFPRFGWDVSGGPTLALPLLGARRMAALDPDLPARLAASLGDPAVEHLFRDALVRAGQAWAELRDQAVLPHREAIEQHWGKVPLLAAVAPAAGMRMSGG